MKFRTLLTAAILGLAGVSLVYAAGEPQKVRQEMMEKVGDSVGAMAKMVKGEKPFDADVVLASLETIAETVKTFPDHFPKGSETGFETEASPKIWENMADFRDHAEKLQMAATAAAADSPANLDELKAMFGPFTKNCGACHELYRIKKK